MHFCEYKNAFATDSTNQASSSSSEEGGEAVTDTWDLYRDVFGDLSSLSIDFNWIIVGLLLINTFMVFVVHRNLNAFLERR